MSYKILTTCDRCGAESSVEVINLRSAALDWELEIVDAGGKSGLVCAGCRELFNRLCDNVEEYKRRAFEGFWNVSKPSIKRPVQWTERLKS